MKTSSVSAILGAVVALCLISGGAGHLGNQRRFLTISDNSMKCTKNMACKYVICPWKRRVEINEEICVFLDDSCSCPAGQMCALTDKVTPGSAIFTFHYLCRRPSSIFKAKTTSNTNGRSSPKNILFYPVGK